METNSQKQEVNVLSFVKRHYPNYSSCNLIAENNDLSAYLNNGTENDTYLEIKEEVVERLSGWCGSDEELQEEIDKEVSKRLYESDSNIYKKSIEGYLKNEYAKFMLATMFDRIG